VNDFSSWEDVKLWLVEDDEYNLVQVGSWTFGRSSMLCGDGCCNDYYSSVDESLDNIKQYSGNDINRVFRVDY